MPTTRDLQRYRPLFARLAVLGDEEAADAALAIDSVDRDPSNSLVKSRLVTEAILKDVIDADPDERDLTIEKMKGRLQGVPRKVLTYVDMVQKLGNEGAHHRSLRATTSDAHNALAALHELTDWYLHTHRGIPRRRSRAPWVVAGLVLALGAFVVVALGGAWWVTRPGPSPTTTTAEVAPVAPVVTLAEPVEPPPAVATVMVSGVPLWSRPWMPWEDPLREEPALNPPVRVCDRGLTNASALARAGAWVRIEAGCDGIATTGWAEASALTGSAIELPRQRPVTYTVEAKSLFHEAKAQLSAERWAEAVAAYDRAIPLVPSDAVLYERRGLARLRLGDATGSLDDLAVCLALSSKSGLCHLYAAEALKALDDPGWNEVLSHAVAHDGTLAEAASAMRKDVRVLRGVGPGGVPIFARPLRLHALRKVLSGTPGSDDRELCRLYDGATIEVLSTVPGWYTVRARCGGGDRDQYMPAQFGDVAVQFEE